MTLADVISDVKFLESNVKDADNGDFASSKGGSIQFAAGTKNNNNLIPTENIARNRPSEALTGYMKDSTEQMRLLSHACERALGIL